MHSLQDIGATTAFKFDKVFSELGAMAAQFCIQVAGIDNSCYSSIILIVDVGIGFNYVL